MKWVVKWNNSSLDLLSLRKQYDKQVEIQTFENAEPEHWQEVSQLLDRKKGGGGGSRKDLRQNGTR